MLHPKLINSYTCAEIPALLSNIDCKLSLLALDLYNNTVFMLNRDVASTQSLILLNYKRILEAKYCNEEYAVNFSVELIASRVKTLTLGCKSECNLGSSLIPPLTTTTSSSSTTTTTTTLNCTRWVYSMTLYLCGDCSVTGGGTLSNFEPLTIGNYYPYNGFKARIDTLITCSGDAPGNFIPANSGVATCEEVICPPTTTTTTII